MAGWFATSAFKTQAPNLSEDARVRSTSPDYCHPEPIQSACVEPEGRNDRCAGPVQVTCHPEREGGGSGGREGSPHKSWCRSTSSAAILRSLPDPHPSLRMTGNLDWSGTTIVSSVRFSACAVNSLRMTGWVVLDSRRRTPHEPALNLRVSWKPCHSAGAEPERRNDRCARQVQVTCHPERRVGVWKGAKDRRVARGSATESRGALFDSRLRLRLRMRSGAQWVRSYFEKRRAGAAI